MNLSDPRFGLRGPRLLKKENALFLGWRLRELAWDGETVRRVLQLLRRQVTGDRAVN